MGEAGDTDKFLEILGNELWSVVGDDARIDARELLEGALSDALDIALGHRLADLPVHDGPAEAIEQRAQADPFLSRGLQVCA